MEAEKKVNEEIAKKVAEKKAAEAAAKAETEAAATEEAPLLLKQPRLLLKHNSHLYFKELTPPKNRGEFFIQVHLWLSSNYKKDSFHTELP